jgi:hypothetical protein
MLCFAAAMLLASLRCLCSDLLTFASKRVYGVQYSAILFPSTSTTSTSSTTCTIVYTVYTSHRAARGIA